MVTITSARSAMSSVSFLGFSPEMSRPSSAIAVTTAGLRVSPGADPAEWTAMLAPARAASSAAAIWDRPALWTQRKRTSGRVSVMGGDLLDRPEDREERFAGAEPGWP